MPERRGGERQCQPWEPLRCAEGGPRLSPLSPLTPSKRQRPWAKVRAPEEPADRGGPAPCPPYPGSPGARASLRHVQPRQAGLRARVFCSHITVIISTGNCPPQPPRSPVPWARRAGTSFSVHPQTHVCPAPASAAPPRVRFIGPKGTLKGSDRT